MKIAAFDYELPEDLIAQGPLPERDASRLLVLPRRSGSMDHRLVRELPGLLAPGDVMVVNDARVIPARLHGCKEGTGGKVELLLVEPLVGADWLALGQASKPLREGARVEVLGSRIEIVQVREGRGRRDRGVLASFGLVQTPRKDPSLRSSAEVTPREMTPFFCSTLRVQQNCHPERFP